MFLFFVKLIVSIALTVAATLIQQSMMKRQQAPQRREPGVRGEIQTGGDNPLAFIVGKYATAGQFEYANTWGTANKTPNAYFVKVVSVSDIPVRGLSGFYVNGARATLGGTPHADGRGYPVLEYRTGSKDHLWVKFYDGTQTEADPYLLAKFGSDPERPWLSDMIGRGVAYFIATALVNRELFPQFPEFLAEIDGIDLEDPREGKDEQENPVLAIRRILLGISYDGTWIYGPQGITENHLIGFAAQADKCDALIDVSGGGSEKRFRCGIEVRADEEPHAVIGELLEACSGRIAETGGRYRILAGEPGEPVLSFTDEDIVISEGQSYEPFPGLEATFNAVTATYPEPQEAWGMKEAPPRYSGPLEAQDDGRRLPFAAEFRAVPYAGQVQRLMRAQVEEARRFRRHSFTAPPAWWELEPLDVVAWTSARNGYENKRFLITVLEDLPNANQLPGLHEIDPADYSWQTAFELPFNAVPVAIQRPPAQPMAGWQVEPYVFVDAESNARRPGILVRFEGELDDVRAVRVQVRLKETQAVVFDGESPYDITVAEPSVVLQGTFLRSTQYQARGIFLPYSGRETAWSDWFDVTTPDVGITEGELDSKIRAFLQQLDVMREAALGPALDELRQIVDGLAQNVSGLIALKDLEIQNSIVNYIGRANANITEVRTVADGLADLFLSVFAGNDVRSGNGLLRFTAVEAPEGVGASFKVEVRASTEQDYAFAGLYIDAAVTALGGQSRIRLVADSVTIENASTGQVFNALLMALQNEPVEVPIVGNELRVDLSNRQIAHYTLVNDDAEIKLPNGIRPGLFWDHTLEMDNVGGHAITFDENLILPPYPTVSDVAGDITVLTGRGVRTSDGVRAIIGTAGFGQTVPPEPNLYTWIEEQGSLASLNFALDAASASSYDNGVSGNWRDLSPSGNEFAPSAAMTFAGTVGSLDHTAYFTSSGGGRFAQTVGSNFAATWGQDNAKFTIGGVFRMPSSLGTNDNDSVPLFGTLQLDNGGGSDRRLRGLIFTVAPYKFRNQDSVYYSPPWGYVNGRWLTIIVGNNGISAFGVEGGMALRCYVDFPSGRMGLWNFIAVALDESAGSNGVTIQVNSTRWKFTSTYSSPYSGVGMGPSIGRVHNRENFAERGARNGTRYALEFGASRRWTDDELDTLYAKIKAARPGYNLP